MRLSTSNSLLLGGMQRSVFSGINPRWDNLVAGWKLNETSDGSAAVSRADVLGVYTLTDNNTVPSTTDGTFGEVANFTAANSEFFSYASPAPPSNTGDWTVAFWMRNTTTTDYQMFLTKSTDIQFFRNSGEYSMALYVNGVATSPTQYTYTGSAWHFVVGWFDTADNKARLQIDDGAINVSGVVTQADNGNALQIGARSGAFFLDGQMHGVYVFNVVKDSDWRTDMYNSGLGRSYPN